MKDLYRISTITRVRDGQQYCQLSCDFGAVAADGDEIVREVAEYVRHLGIYGRGCFVTGRMSVPVAFVVGHAFGHMFGFVAVFDPKIGTYIVVTAHADGVVVGDRVEWIGGE